MARLKLSPSGLRSPLDLTTVRVETPEDVAPADDAAPRAARLRPATASPRPTETDRAETAEARAASAA
ncbi:hypothetical protein ACVU7I_16710, partial [Patulibacter sp. S7RM1-6]